MSVQLQSKTGTVLVDRQLLVATSKVFRILEESIQQKWQLQDFSQPCLEQYAEFAQTYGHLDMKSEEIKGNLFIKSKSIHELMELLFLTNYIGYDLLFRLCCMEMARWAPNLNLDRGLGISDIPYDQIMCRIRDLKI